MADVIFVAMVLGFFGLCVAYVRGLERLIGADDEPEADVRRTSPTETGDVAR